LAGDFNVNVKDNYSAERVGACGTRILPMQWNYFFYGPKFSAQRAIY
jgi:hypothetical protein